MKSTPGGVAVDYTRPNYSTKRFPPYGRKLDQLRRKGLIPCLRVIVSTRWELGAQYPRIVISNNIPVTKINFSFLTGLSVQIVHGEGEGQLISNLIEEILKIKPKMLTVFNYDLAKQNYSGNPAMTLIYPESLEVLNGL